MNLQSLQRFPHCLPPRFPTLLATAALATLLAGGCSSGEGNGSAAEGSNNAAASSSVVAWPELRALDDLSHRADALAARNDMAGLRDLAPRLAAAAQAAAASPLPRNAKSPEQLQAMQSDLASLAASLAPASGDDGEPLADADLAAASAAFHPLVLRMLAAAGMPHVHGGHDGHGHDGHGHDHSHDGHSHDGHDHDHGHDDHQRDDHVHDQHDHDGHDHGHHH